ncbi:MAG: hypothetical protein DSM106950_00535 [Stigonema ocellatum SAG 48.90 = DSM 106950]|nr:hypothetical protein [Stigonema ocellatum SAG 48.90 = DSM 106950]
MNDNQEVPNKPQINFELPTQFGGKRVQQLDIQGDRTHPIADFNWYILNQLGVPSRFSDVIADILLWVAASSFLASVSKQLIQFAGVSVIIAVISVLALALSIYILKIATVPKVRWSLVYRWFLIFLGVCLGVR